MLEDYKSTFLMPCLTLIPLILLMGVAGCGALDEAAPAPPGSLGDAADAKGVAGEKPGDNQGDGANPGGGDYGGEYGDDGSLGDVDDVVEDGPDAEEIARQCGNVDLENPDKLIFSQDLTGLPIVKRGTVIFIDYEVTVLGKLEVRGTARQSTTTTSFTVSADPALAQSTAEEEVAKRAGTTTTTFVEPGERSALVDLHDSWAGILCVVQPAVSIHTQVGGMDVQTSFDPPVPSSISPKADEVRYEKEVPEEVVWTGLTATVESSTNTLVPAGTVLNGSVTVRPIDPTMSHTLDDGQTITLKTDRAFEVIADFGSPELTAAIGLRPLTRYYIDHEGHQFKAIKSEAGSGETPTAVFVGN